MPRRSRRRQALPVNLSTTDLDEQCHPGWEPFRKNCQHLGNTFHSDGTTYSNGIGTHAASQIVYTLNGQYSTFTPDIGIDAEEDGKGQGSSHFQVIGDGNVLFDSGVLTGSSPVDHINISIVGVQTLTLMANKAIANNIDYDHADWAGAVLWKLATAPWRRRTSWRLPLGVGRSS